MNLCNSGSYCQNFSRQWKMLPLCLILCQWWHWQLAGQVLAVCLLTTISVVLSGSQSYVVGTLTLDLTCGHSCYGNISISTYLSHCCLICPLDIRRYHLVCTCCDIYWDTLLPVHVVFNCFSPANAIHKTAPPQVLPDKGYVTSSTESIYDKSSVIKFRIEWQLSVLWSLFLWQFW